MCVILLVLAALYLLALLVVGVAVLTTVAVTGGVNGVVVGCRGEGRWSRPRSGGWAVARPMDPPAVNV